MGKVTDIRTQRTRREQDARMDGSSKDRLIREAIENANERLTELERRQESIDKAINRLTKLVKQLTKGKAEE